MMQFDVNRLMQVMSEIMSDKYDLKITITARPKEMLTDSSAAACES